MGQNRVKMPKCVNFHSRAVYMAQQGVSQFCCPLPESLRSAKKKKKTEEEKRSIIFYRSSPVALTRERHISIPEWTCRRRFVFVCSKRRPVQADMAACPRGGVGEQTGNRRRVMSQHKLTSPDLMKGGKKTLSSWISRVAGLAAPPTAIATCVKAGVWSHAFPDQQLHRFHTLPHGSQLESRRCPCRALASTDALTDPGRRPNAHAGPSKASWTESRLNWKEICRLSFTRPRTV